MYLTQSSGKVPRTTLLGWIANTKERNLDQDVRSEKKSQMKKPAIKVFYIYDSSDESNLLNNLRGYSIDNSAIDDANNYIVERDTTYHAIYYER